MDYKNTFRKIVNFLSKNCILVLLLNLVGGYVTLFIAFALVVTECSAHKSSDWFLENFESQHSVSPEECKIRKLMQSQESLGHEFEKVIFENLLDLSET